MKIFPTWAGTVYSEYDNEVYSEYSPIILQAKDTVAVHCMWCTVLATDVIQEPLFPFTMYSTVVV